VAHACNLSTREAKEGGSQVQDPVSKNKKCLPGAGGILGMQKVTDNEYRGFSWNDEDVLKFSLNVSVKTVDPQDLRGLVP
jgi:hypothetical protein